MVIQDFLRMVLEKPAFVNYNLSVETTRNIHKIFADTTFNFIMFDNAGGRLFDISELTENKIPLLDYFKEDMNRKYLYAYRYRGEEFINTDCNFYRRLISKVEDKEFVF